jgi:hypothetical protein
MSSILGRQKTPIPVMSGKGAALKEDESVLMLRIITAL